MVDDRLDPDELAALWDFSDPAASEARFLDEIAIREVDTPANLELATQLARALGLQGRFDEAKAILGPIDSPNERVMTRKYLELGRVFNSSSEPGKAVPHFSKAATLAREAGDSYVEVDAYHMLAIADPTYAEDWTMKGLAVADASTDPRTRNWRGPLRNNLAWAFHDAGHFEEALVEFNLALEIFQEVGKPEQIHIAWWSVARCLRSLGRNGEARAIQQRLAAEDPPDPYVDEELAQL
jgi:tetratricopeptide (TPR) repeat protein